MSDKIVGRIDDMGSKIDELERSIAELMQQAGVEPTKWRLGYGGNIVSYETLWYLEGTEQC